MNAHNLAQTEAEGCIQQYATSTYIVLAVTLAGLWRAFCLASLSLIVVSPVISASVLPVSWFTSTGWLFMVRASLALHATCMYVHVYAHVHVFCMYDGC